MSPFMVPPPPRTSTPPATPVTAPLRPSHWLWLVALLATASALRFYLAATMPTWFVEIFILRTITLPLGDELRQAGNDIHPPLQFVLRWAWAHVGGVGVLWQK